MPERTKLDIQTHPRRIPKVPHVDGGKLYDIVFNSMRKARSATLPTYAVVASRSYHTFGVNLLLMDGSARTVSDSVVLEVWRALVRRAGGEVAIQME